MRMMRWCILLMLMTLLVACRGIYPGWGMHRRQPALAESYNSNGEQIYFTGVNSRGEFITYSGGPGFGGMMNSVVSCVSCHGSDGRGGLHWMHMQRMDAPDIRYSSLSMELEEHQGAGHDVYNLEDFRLAVIDGSHPDGEPLDENMPNWQINDADLADLFEYIKTLP